MLARLSMSVAVLFRGVGSAPLPPSSVTVALLVMLVTPAGSGLFTFTVTVRVIVDPTGTLPMFQVTTLPAKTFAGPLTAGTCQ